MRKFGLYEATEKPKGCVKCQSTRSDVIAKWETLTERIRKRKCECGKEYITRVKKDVRFI